MVEATGLGALLSLAREALGLGAPAGDLTRPAADSAVAPRLVGVDVGAKVKLAAGILRAMSLTRGFAPLVALIGHGAGTENNPLAAGLHCGACGGQTGEVNARALAALLNEPDVRAGLLGEGISVPSTTRFVAGLHQTTTDEVVLFDRDERSHAHASELATLRAQLAAAGQRAREERAPRLSLAPSAATAAALRARACDPSEPRPEWGLARNAAFVVAPRERTRGRDLDGRAFLHEYRWEEDRDFAVLEAIMTAPMVVTHWINMQYYASTVDPDRQGSGNKTLHNVVGGRLGVFEGGGGDLRIGLARQSVHDGVTWVHEPLRLSVFIEAPAPAIARVLERHPLVRDLVENEWLFLFQLEPGGAGVARWHRSSWVREGSPGAV